MANDPYGFGAALYDRLLEPFMRPIRRRTADLLMAHFGSGSGARILEVACGTGSQARRIARHGFHVIGLDLSPGMIGEAGRKRAGTAPGSLSVIRADATRLPFSDAAFDAVVIQFSLHEMDPDIRRACMREITRVARTDARLAVADFAPTRTVGFHKLLLNGVELTAGWRHFTNGRHFVRTGGVGRILLQNGFSVHRAYPFFGGNVLLVEAQKALRAAHG